ncbi:MAG: LuxR C-terminal-related transcriptional regulator [Candidatus Omnitrophica bacterium]|nr:LuxR C-terminal-related transcriptional regulator [Candidatus Omnitrophota bacterium]
MTLSQDEIRQIIQMRGLGYTQQEIANHLGISRKTVENHLRRLKEQAQEAEQENSLDDLFWGIVLGAGALALLSALLGKGQK